ncbi:MAG: hypothetical protein ACOC0E_05890 [Spirochaetota bacterium]
MKLGIVIGAVLVIAAVVLVVLIARRSTSARSTAATRFARSRPNPPSGRQSSPAISLARAASWI